MSEAPPDWVSPKITAAKVAEADLQKLIEAHKAGLTLAPAPGDNGKLEVYQFKSIKRDDYAINCKTAGGEMAVRTI